MLDLLRRTRRSTATVVSVVDSDHVATAAPLAARTAALLREQAQGCEVFGSPLYADLLRHAADDLAAGGPTASVLEGHLGDRGPSALGLRLMGGIHAMVLTGKAPALAPYFPSVSAEPRPLDHDGRSAMTRLLTDCREEIRAWLLSPPQTNEVGRGAALVGGLLYVVDEADLPIRLVEIGTSAGLNLRADHFHIDGAIAGYGDTRSPVRLHWAWQGFAPPDHPIRVVERIGSDVAPIDPTSESGQLTLTSYVWADQAERLARLRGAIRLASRIPATIRQERAIDTARSLQLADDSWTVLWHSVMFQYLEPAERDAVEARIAEVAASATDRRRFAVLTFEPQRRTPDGPFEFLVALQTWPGGGSRILGTAAPHGIPVTWEAPVG